MSVEAIRELVGRLGIAANALSALGAALMARTKEGDTTPEIRRHLDEVLGALGIRDALAEVSAPAARSLLGEIRVTFLHGATRFTLDRRVRGWTHSNPEILQAAGDVSAGFAVLLQRHLPRLDGLVDRLTSEGARFLDVGVGVGALSIGMARQWSTLRVVGIDVWPPSLELARQNVIGAGLEGRIELREQAVESLADSDTFDLAWLPSAFIPGAAVPEALRRLHRALKKGGWTLFAAVAGGSDPLSASLARLRTAEWGAYPWTPQEAVRLLEQAGFAEITDLPSPPGAVATFVAGRVPV